MIKGKLIESVRQLVLKQAPTQDSLKLVHPRVLEAEIAKAFSTALKEYYLSDINLMDGNLDAFSKKFLLDAEEEEYVDTTYTGKKKNVKTGRKVVALPATPVALKKNLGLRNVKAAYGSHQFVRSSETEIDSIRSLDVYCCANKVFYYTEGNKLYMESGISEFNLITKVHVRMIVHFDDLEDTDEVEFPLGEMAGVQQIMQLMGFRETDNTDDDVK